MATTYKQLPNLGYPHYVLSAPPWLLHIFRVLAWGATIAFFVWGVPNILENDENIWAMWVMGGILLVVSIGFARPASFKPTIHFACDTNGVFIMYEQDKYVFTPWVDVRDIRIDSILSSGSGSQTGLVVEAKIEDNTVAERLFRTHVLSNKEPLDEQGYGQLGVSNNARSMTRAMGEITRIRRLAGLSAFDAEKRS